MQIKKVFSVIALMFFVTLISQACDGIEKKKTGLAMLESLTDAEIINAKEKLVIAYGHTSHGSQIVDGVNGLDAFMTGRGKASGLYEGLDLREDMGGYGSAYGGYDLNQPQYGDWADATRSYLDSHSDINVVIWSWCGGVSHADEATINTYLSDMTQLENDYPGVVFVYMTGHLDGTGLEGNLHLRNEQIREYCRLNNKLLFDFADIESYDPDGNYYADKYATDGCYYDTNNDGSAEADDASNWAITWQNNNPGEWYNCSSAHSQPLNANMKAYAFWHLMVQIANGM